MKPCPYRYSISRRDGTVPGDYKCIIGGEPRFVNSIDCDLCAAGGTMTLTCPVGRTERTPSNRAERRLAKRGKFKGG